MEKLEYKKLAAKVSGLRRKAKKAGRHFPTLSEMGITTNNTIDEAIEAINNASSGIVAAVEQQPTATTTVSSSAKELSKVWILRWLATSARNNKEGGLEQALIRSAIGRDTTNSPWFRPSTIKAVFNDEIGDDEIKKALEVASLELKDRKAWKSALEAHYPTVAQYKAIM